MDPLTVLSVACLAVVGTLASVGVFFTNYKDTLLERVGMSLIAIWCFVRVVNKFDVGNETEPVHGILHFGLLLFAIGFATEVCKGSSRKRVV